MRTVFFLLTLLCAFLAAQGKYLHQPPEEKAARRDLRFLVTFDQYHAKAQVAGGEALPYTVKDLNLQLRGTITAVR